MSHPKKTRYTKELICVWKLYMYIGFVPGSFFLFPRSVQYTVHYIHAFCISAGSKEAGVHVNMERKKNLKEMLENNGGCDVQ